MMFSESAPHASTVVCGSVRNVGQYGGGGGVTKRLGPNSRNCDYLSRDGLSRLSEPCADSAAGHQGWPHLAASHTDSTYDRGRRLVDTYTFRLENHARYERSFIKPYPRFDRSQNWCTIYNCSEKNNISILVILQLYLEAPLPMNITMTTPRQPHQQYGSPVDKRCTQ